MSQDEEFKEEFAKEPLLKLKSVPPELVPVLKDAGYYCYDGNTEVLTEAGWKLFKDVEAGEKVLCRTEKGLSEWMAVQKTFSFNYEGELIRIKSAHVDLLVTPNHKILFRNRYGKVFFDEAQRHFGKWDIYFFKDIKMPSEKMVSPTWAKFAGYYVSEGSLTFQPKHKGTISLSNSNTEILEDMKTICEDLGLKYGVSTIHNPASEIKIAGRIVKPTKDCHQVVVCKYDFAKTIEEQCGKGSHYKHLPEGFLCWNYDSRKVLFETLMKGDGSWRSWGTAGVYGTASRRLADEVQLLALSLGYSATLRVRKDPFYDTFYYVINIAIKENRAFVDGHHWSKERYNGKVYSIQVPPPHIILVRRNGNVVWSGNTVESLAIESPHVLFERVGERRGFNVDKAGQIVREARGFLKVEIMTVSELLEEEKARRCYSTGSKKLDEILGGGLREQEVTEASGPYGVGKTELVYTAALLIAHDYKAGSLIYDTEATFKAERLCGIARARGFNLDEVIPLINYSQIYGTEHLVFMLENAHKPIRERHIQFMAIDSLVSPFRAEYLGRELLAPRQQLINRCLRMLINYARAYKIAVLVTDQVLATPIAYAYEGRPEITSPPVGGNITAHGCNNRIYIRTSAGSTRIATLFDSSYMPRAETTFRITEKGMEDIPEKVE